MVLVSQPSPCLLVVGGNCDVQAPLAGYYNMSKLLLVPCPHHVSTGQCVSRTESLGCVDIGMGLILDSAIIAQLTEHSRDSCADRIPLRERSQCQFAMKKLARRVVDY
jgi:hypothetical protein